MVLGAQATLYPDLVVLTGLRPGAEHLGALAAADAGVAYAVVLPYPDPAAGWPEAERAWFDRACDAASQVVTLERTRPSDLAGRRASMQRRDGWLRSASRGAVVVTDGRDAEAELLLRRFTESLEDDVWTLEIDPLWERRQRSTVRRGGVFARGALATDRRVRLVDVTDPALRSGTHGLLRIDEAVGMQLGDQLAVRLGDLLP